MSERWESNRMVLWALGVGGFDGRVLAVLAAHANIETKQTWVGQPSIASYIYRVPKDEVAKWMVKRVSEATSRLQAAGHLEIKRNGHRCADGSFTNLYTLTEPTRPRESPNPRESPQAGPNDSPALRAIESPRPGGQTQEKQRRATTNSSSPGVCSSSQANSNNSEKTFNELVAEAAHQKILEKFEVKISPSALARMLDKIEGYEDEVIVRAFGWFLEERECNIVDADNPPAYILGGYFGYLADHADDVRARLEEEQAEAV